MSNLRIAVVAEGPTDLVVITAALEAILPKPPTIQLLQPEDPSGERGAGWGGVLKWCWEFRTRNLNRAEDDPTPEGFDFLIIHLDADVAGELYSNALQLVDLPFALANFGALPCEKPCPPPADSVNELKAVVTSWIGIGPLGDKTKLCIPSKSIEAWLAAAVLPTHSHLIKNIECEEDMEEKLKQLPVRIRIRKSKREYEKHASTVTANWKQVQTLCNQAEAFHQDMQ